MTSIIAITVVLSVLLLGCLVAFGVVCLPYVPYDRLPRPLQRLAFRTAHHSHRTESIAVSNDDVSALVVSDQS
ncbi:MAG TPA: hypothetical protein VN081_00570 [Dongiaceae bacterium]|nr:hypothetical protein [Dongiaceae bacterium]